MVGRAGSRWGWVAVCALVAVALTVVLTHPATGAARPRVLATVTYPNVGLVGVTNGEHFQLDVANVSRSSTPCLATLRVVGITGRVFMSSDVSLGAGRGAVLDFTPAVGASPRTEVRAVVVSKGDSCKAFQGSVEVVDDSNDRTVLWGGFTDPAG